MYECSSVSVFIEHVLKANVRRDSAEMQTPEKEIVTVRDKAFDLLVTDLMNYADEALKSSFSFLITRKQKKRWKV